MRTGGAPVVAAHGREGVGGCGVFCMVNEKINIVTSNRSTIHNADAL